MYKFFISALLSAAVALSTPAVHAKTVRKGSSAKPAGAKVVKKGSPVKRATTKRRKQVLAQGRAVAAPRDRMVRKVVRVNGKRKVVYERVLARTITPARPSAGDLAGLNRTPDPLSLASNVAFVIDQENAEVLLEKNADVALPIASITKLMTGLVVVEARQDLEEVLVITHDDVDREKFTSSRLAIGSRVRRADLLHISLMSSENRAAAALARNYPGGVPAFVEAMNAKARELGMTDTRYVDSSGLSSRNVSSARDLAKLASYAYREPLLRQFSTDPKSIVDAGGRMMHYNNTNYLVSMPDWNIGLQKTGK